METNTMNLKRFNVEESDASEEKNHNKPGNHDDGSTGSDAQVSNNPTVDDTSGEEAKKETEETQVDENAENKEDTATDNNNPAHDANEEEEITTDIDFDPNADYKLTLKEKNYRQCLSRFKKPASLAKGLAGATIKIGILSLLLGGPVLGVVAFLAIRYNAEIYNMAEYIGYKPTLIPAPNRHKDKAAARAKRIGEFKMAAPPKIKRGMKNGLFRARVGGKQFLKNARNTFDRNMGSPTM